MIYKYIKSEEKDDLKQYIKSNLDHYKLDNDQQWLDSFFGNDNWYLDSPFEADEIQLLNSNGKKHFDIENVKILYEAFRKLPFRFAIDERFWVYQSHVTFLDYIKTRWPLESYTKDKPHDFIKTHYFFGVNSDRGIIRNGVAMLWWYGYLTYDENRQNRFELTEVLLKNTEVTLQCATRAFPRNKKILRAILSVPLEDEELGELFFNRQVVRAVMSYLNQIGGVTILDSLEELDIKILVKDKLKELKGQDLTQEIEDETEDH